MKLSLSSVGIWQSLRKLARNDNEPLTGRALRPGMSRRTKCGDWLDNLVTLGLLEVVALAEPVAPKYADSEPEPVQLRTTYRLTSAGIVTADTGEYELPERNPIPVFDGWERPEGDAREAEPAPKKVAKRKAR